MVTLGGLAYVSPLSLKSLRQLTQFSQSFPGDGKGKSWLAQWESDTLGSDSVSATDDLSDFSHPLLKMENMTGPSSRSSCEKQRRKQNA